MITSLRAAGAAVFLSVLGVAAPAFAQEGDYAAKLSKQMNACAVVCLDDNDLVFFGALTVPLQRPSVEFCGELLSMSKAERAQKEKDERAAIAAEAQAKKYSPREHQALRKMAADKSKKCDTDLNRHCADARAKYSLDDRKAALERTRKAIADAGEEGRSAALARYLTNVLAYCPLDQ